jgi:hypothetical protein
MRRLACTFASISKNMKTMKALLKKSGALLVVLFTLFAANSCKKDSGPNVLGGETNIPLTQKDSVTDHLFYREWRKQSAGGFN